MTDLSRLFDRMAEWPESWQMDEADIATGDALVAVFASFVASLAGHGLALRTIQRHVDNLWLLGGEIISKMNVYPEGGLGVTRCLGA